MTMPSTPLRRWTIGEISNGGERVTHLYPNDCYFAHLSLYAFALPFAREGYVLDAGSGAGYGSAYFADNGARFVWGVDASSEAVAFSRDSFPRYNLQYQTMALEQLDGFPANLFDLIYSSNVLEHVYDVHAFLRKVCGLLKPDGTVVIIVPPITTPELRATNIAIPFHLNIWSPRQWLHTLEGYFHEVRTYGHYLHRIDRAVDFQNSPEQTVINEHDFVFPQLAVADLYDNRTLSAIFVARRPYDAEELPTPGAFSFVDDSFTRPASVVLPDEPGAWQYERDRYDHHIAVQDQQLASLRGECASLQRYATHLEAELVRKNQHIARLEALVERISNGHVMRLLALFGKS